MIVRPTRRDVLRYGSAAALAALPAPAIAQAWPSKPIRIIVTYPAGGLTDVFARAYGEYVSQKVGQPVVVENKTGAAGAIGAEMVKSSPADGYTLMFTNSTTMIMNKVLFKKLPYDPDKDFALVAWFNTGHLPTIINKDVPAKNVAEFAAWARDRKVSLATYGAGSYAHVVTETLNRHYGLKMEAVHYRGEALMWQDVASGAVQGASGSYASASAVLQTGAGRPIAVPTMERMKKLPDVPTFYEQGLTEKAFQVRGWVGCCGAGRHARRRRPEALRPHGRGRQDRAHPEDHRHLRHRRGGARPHLFQEGPGRGRPGLARRHQEPEHRAAMSGK